MRGGGRYVEYLYNSVLRLVWSDCGGPMLEQELLRSFIAFRCREQS